MALVAYPPKPGCRIRVIGAGLPRTATNSFCAALEILLDGPAYHLGVQTALSDSETHVLTWIKVLQKRPYRSEADRQEVLKLISTTLDGYVVTADPPLTLLIPELMELYPDAVVICSTREVEAWARSMETIAKLVKPMTQRFIFFWVKNVRWLPKMWDLLPSIFNEVHGGQMRTVAEAKSVLEKHHRWLEEIVPKDKLFYADVKDGWAPLCRALNVDIPKDVPFPRLNDSKAFEEIFRNWAVQGLLRWALVVALFTSLLAGVAAIWGR